MGNWTYNETARIVLLQSDASDRDALGQILNALHFRVTTAGCIDEAVAMIDNVAPDFLVVDEGKEYEALLAKAQEKNTDVLTTGTQIQKPFEEFAVAAVMRQAMIERYPNPNLGRKGNYKVINLDDKEVIMKVVMLFLQSEDGIDYIPIVDEEEGLQRCIEEQPDLIITDIRKPKINGREVMRIAKAHPQLCYIPIIVLSSEYVPDICEQYGAVKRVVKPFNPKAFKETLLAQLKAIRSL